jgi:hypothetical protein
MQIAASPTLEYVSADDIPEEVFQKELEVEMGREDLQSKVGVVGVGVGGGYVCFEGGGVSAGWSGGVGALGESKRANSQQPTDRLTQPTPNQTRPDSPRPSARRSPRGA